jgi:GT2 family glycosyltransferase
MKNVDVVIISWARDEDLLRVTKNGLDTLFQSSREDVSFHAYIVETNSEINYDDYNLLYTQHSCTTIHPNSEFGYHKFLNIGRRAGNSPYVVLCNSDLTYEKDWASSIIEVMETYLDILSASPWCPQTQGNNTSHRGMIYEGCRVRGELAGWCIFQQRKIYDIIGELDEQFRFWYCDNDYSMELQTKGIRHVLVPNSVVNHHENNLGKTGVTLTTEEQHNITSAQESIFIEKWNKIF